MHPLAETLLDEPVIAAVKTDDALTAALASPCSTVFLLASTLLNVGELVRRIHAAGKLAVVHIDLVDGLSAREVAVNSLIALCHPDGIISTHPSLIRRARHQGLLTIQRAFILDSLSLNNSFRPAGTRLAGLCGDPARHHRLVITDQTHPGAGDRGRSAAGQGRRHGRHAGRCLGGVHLLPGASGTRLNSRKTQKCLTAVVGGQAFFMESSSVTGGSS